MIYASMREGFIIDMLSDTHGRHRQIQLPGGDMLIHSGDATSYGALAETISFLDWLGSQDYSYRIFVPGNHDRIFETDLPFMKEECKKRGIILLVDSGIEIEGIKIYGSPVTPWFHDWAFNRHRGEPIKRHWDLIPEDTDILITHGPAHGILDYVPRPNGVMEHCGCADLLAKIYETKIKLHVFGHIHYASGVKYADGRTFVNAANLNEAYTLQNGSKRIVIENGQFLVNESP
jgi:Icc-related predicted phosphoesterase